MAERPVTVIHAGDPRKVIFGAGDEYHYLATGQETDGHYFLMEGIVPPGGGPPPHIQTREEEAFYILEGEVTFYAQGNEVLAKAGTFLNIPKDVKHNFRNNTQTTARMLIFFAPAGLEGLFDQMAAPTEEAAEEAEVTLEALNAMGAEYGLEFFGG